MKYYFILNPAAGSGEKGKQFLALYEKLKALNKYDVNIYETVGVGDSTRFVAETGSTTTPSTGILLPGFTIIISPTSTSSIGISISSFPFDISAVLD